MRINPTLILFCCCSHLALAQNTGFEKVISFPIGESVGVNKIVKSAQGHYILAGGCTYDNICGGRAAVAALDSNGTLLWGGAIENLYLGDNLYDAIATPDSGVIMVGTGLVTNPFPTVPNLLIIKLDKNGNLEWTVADTPQVAAMLGMFGLSIEPSGDGNYLVMAASASPVIYKISLSGNLIWARECNTTANGGVFLSNWADACLMPNGKIAGVFQESNFTPHFRIAIFDSTGYIEKVNRISSQAHDFTPRCIRSDSDNGFIVTGKYGKQNALHDSIAIVQLDSNLAVTAAYMIATPFEELKIYDVVADGSGGFVFAGSTTTHYLIIHMDANGNIINSLRSTDTKSLRSILRDNNRWVFGGVNNGMNFFAISTDSTFSNPCNTPMPLSSSPLIFSSAAYGLGSNVPYFSSWHTKSISFLTPSWSDGCLAIGINEFKNSGFEIFPNPATDQIVIAPLDQSGFYSFFISDAHGNTVMRNQNESLGTANVKISEWAPGVYFVTIISDQSIFTKKLAIIK